MKRLTFIVLVLALVAAACGSGPTGDAGPVPTAAPTTSPTPTSTPTDPGTVPPSPTTTTTQAPADQAFVELFFITESLTATSVTRAVDLPEVAGNAIRALIDGPTPAEQDTELFTSIPPDTLLLGLTIADGLATIDLSREFEAGGGTTNILSRLAQVVYTLTQFPTVDEVLFMLDGAPVEVFSGEGVLLGDPVDRSDYATILPIDPVPVADAQRWDQGDLPDVSSVDPSVLGRVALVTSDDVLNVRRQPSADAEIVGMLEPGVVVRRTGAEQVTGSSIWVEIDTPAGSHWVNSWFLAAVVDADDFAADARVTDLLDRFADIVAADGDLRPVMSRRGVYVWHHADPIRFSASELASILTDTTTYRWPSNAISPDDPEFEAIPARTFAEAVADSFLSAYDDPDTVTTVNEPIEAGNGRIPEAAIPFRFRSFNYVGVHDSGDNPEFGGLDWTTWYVSVDYEDGDPVIIALIIDQWSP